MALVNADAGRSDPVQLRSMAWSFVNSRSLAMTVVPSFAVAVGALDVPVMAVVSKLPTVAPDGELTLTKTVVHEPAATVSAERIGVSLVLNAPLPFASLYNTADHAPSELLVVSVTAVATFPWLQTWCV